MTPTDIQAECERLFQNGGPKVYTYNPERFIPHLRASHTTAKRALLHADAGDQVWARRKMRAERRYEWVMVGVGK